MPIYGIFYKHALPLIFRFRYTQKNTRSYCPGHSWIEVLFFAVRCSLFAVRCDNSQLRTTEQPNTATPLLLLRHHHLLGRALALADDCQVVDAVL